MSRLNNIIIVMAMTALCCVPRPCPALSARLECKSVLLKLRTTSRGEFSLYSFSPDPERGILPLEIAISIDAGEDARNRYSHNIRFYVRPEEESCERIELMRMTYWPTDNVLDMDEVYFMLKDKHPELIGRSAVGPTIRQGVFFLLSSLYNRPGLRLNVHGMPNIKLLALFRSFMDDIGISDFSNRKHVLDMSSRHWFANGLLRDLRFELATRSGDKYTVGLYEIGALTSAPRIVVMDEAGEKRQFVSCKVAEDTDSIRYLDRKTGRLMLEFDKHSFEVTYIPLRGSRVISCTTGARMHFLSGVPHVPANQKLWRLVGRERIEESA